MVRRIFLLGALCLALAACATPHKMTQDTIDSLGVKEVRVNTTSAFVSWPAEEEKFKRQHVTPNAVSQQEMQAHLRKRVQEMVQEHYDAKFKPYFLGPRKVRLDVDVKGLTIPSLAARVLVSDIASFSANFTIVDIKTGEVIAQYPNAAMYKKMIGGIMAPIADAVSNTGADPAEELVLSQVLSVRNWVTKSGQ